MKLNRVIILLFLFLSIKLEAKMVYCLIDLTRLNMTKINTFIANMDSETDNKFSNLHYYIFNSTNIAKSTRAIVEVDEKLLSKTFIGNLITDGTIQKIMEAEVIVTADGIRTIKRIQILDYLHTPTSWYMIYQVGTSTPIR